MGVGRYPGAAFGQRREAWPDVQVILQKAGGAFRTIQELTPGELVAFQAGQLEAAEALRRRRIVRAVHRANALKCDPIQLLAHMREAFGIAIEVDQVNLHGAWLSASTPARSASGACLSFPPARRSYLH